MRGSALPIFLLYGCSSSCRTALDAAPATTALPELTADARAGVPSASSHENRLPAHEASQRASGGAEPSQEKPAAPSSSGESNHPGPSPSTTLGPGFRRAGPWLSFYGTAVQMGNLDRIAAKYAILNIDADPDAGNFTDAQIAKLANQGRNQVLSYLNLGSCERFRSYWSKAPANIAPCRANRAAHLGAYEGYPDEVWMNVGNASYQRLILEHVAKRLAARGIDGFYLDNMEIVEHRECDGACRHGGLELVRRLREAFPRMLIVMQNATSEVTRTGVTNGIPFPLLLDGIAHEEVYNPRVDEGAERELLAWQSLKLRSRDGYPFWIGIEDYVGNCRNQGKASMSFRRGQARGFSVYVSDSSAGQKRICDFDE